MTGAIPEAIIMVMVKLVGDVLIVIDSVFVGRVARPVICLVGRRMTIFFGTCSTQCRLNRTVFLRF